MTTFTQLTAKLKNLLRGWLLVLSLKEGLVECATVCVKIWVILNNNQLFYNTPTKFTIFKNSFPLATGPFSCGEVNAEAGQIQSVNYPNNYPNNEECVWVITAPFG